MRAFLGLALLVAGVFSPGSGRSQQSIGPRTPWNLGPSLAVHARATPEVSITYFHNLPTRLYYFDDTTVSVSVHL
jgi:hypothetical protein